MPEFCSVPRRLADRTFYYKRARNDATLALRLTCRLMEEFVGWLVFVNNNKVPKAFGFKYIPQIKGKGTFPRVFQACLLSIASWLFAVCGGLAT